MTTTTASTPRTTRARMERRVNRKIEPSQGNQFAESQIVRQLGSPDAVNETYDPVLLNVPTLVTMSGASVTVSVQLPLPGATVVASTILAVRLGLHGHHDPNDHHYHPAQETNPAQPYQNLTQLPSLRVVSQGVVKTKTNSSSARDHGQKTDHRTNAN